MKRRKARLVVETGTHEDYLRVVQYLRENKVRVLKKSAPEKRVVIDRPFRFLLELVPEIKCVGPLLLSPFSSNPPR